MGVEGSMSGAERGGAISQEPLDGKVIVELETWGNVEGCNVLSGKGDLDFWAGSGLEGRLGGH